MSLATTDDAGTWVADVIHIWDDDLNLYWMSDPNVRHSKAILRNPRVAAAITASNKIKEANFGVQLSGIAQKLEGMHWDLCVKHLMKRGYPSPSKAFDVLQGDSWYMIKPDFFDLIDEANFGFEKQKLHL